jgi:hypothetical protein
MSSDRDLPPVPLVDRGMVERTFHLLSGEDGVLELRIMSDNPRFGVISGYFDDAELFADAACAHAYDGPGTLVLLNPGKPELLFRRTNRLEFRAKSVFEKFIPL